MPLSPIKQQERRARLKRLVDPPKTKRRRCDNCGTVFEVDPKYPHKRFHSDACRKEYHWFGSAFGPLKDKLEKLVASMVKEKLGAFQARIEYLERMTGNSVPQNDADRFPKRFTGGKP